MLLPHRRSFNRLDGKIHQAFCTSPARTRVLPALHVHHSPPPPLLEVAAVSLFRIAAYLPNARDPLNPGERENLTASGGAESGEGTRL